MMDAFATIPLQADLFDGVDDKLIQDINGLLPHVVYAVVIGLVGFVAATLVEGRLARFVNRMDVADEVQDSTFGELFLTDRRRLGDFLGLLVKVYIYLLTAFLIANELALGRVAAALNGVITFLPTAVVTLVVLAVGFWLADVVKDRVAAATTEDAEGVAEVFGLSIQLFVYVIAVVVAFSVLAGTSGGAGFAIPIMQVFTLGFALAFVLAIGWAAKEYLEVGGDVVAADD